MEYGQHYTGGRASQCSCMQADVTSIDLLPYVWMYGCMDVWIYTCMDACMNGCMNVWIYGCMDVWMYGCMDVSCKTTRVHG